MTTSSTLAKPTVEATLYAKKASLTVAFGMRIERGFKEPFAFHGLRVARIINIINAAFIGVIFPAADNCFCYSPIRCYISAHICLSY